MADYIPFNLQTESGEKSYWAAILAKKIVVYIVCVMLTLMCILPFLFMFFNATKSRLEVQGAKLDWWPALPENSIAGSLLPSKSFSNNWKILFIDEIGGMKLPFVNAFINSFIISAGSTLLSVYFSSLTAYGFTAYRFRGSKPLYAFILAVMMVPAQISVLGFIGMMRGIGWYGTFLPLIIPAIAAPSTVFFMRQYMIAALSLELVEAGRIDGCTEFGIFNRLVLPILMPGMATMAIFAMVGSWNSLFIPTMLLGGNDPKMFTVPMVVDMIKSNKYAPEIGAMYLGLSATAVPLIVFYLILSRYIIAGVALGGIKE
ncbi:MAG: carbohydrate ABC transporter permease [Oscillospiraceae bacterium]|jgi:multiple sugar transport system permease protein|nr:carbohydrate ABC transporter permease [Oscillospiraceae bacterium]